MTGGRLRAALVLAAAVAFAAAPFVSGEFGGYDPDDFPVPQRDAPVQPAGYAFAIWSVIYLWLIAHGVRGLLRRAEDPGWDAARPPLLLSLAVGVPWIWVALASPLAATAMIWVMAVAAIVALFRAEGAGERWWLGAPIGLYAGWLTAAASVSLGLVGAGWGVAMGGVGWAWASLAVALAIAVVVQRKAAPVPEYGLAVAWALAAVAVSNAGQLPFLTVAAAGGAAAMAALALWPVRRR